MLELKERGAKGIRASQGWVLSGRQSRPRPTPPRWPPGAESRGRMRWGSRKAMSQRTVSNFGQIESAGEKLSRRGEVEH